MSSSGRATTALVLAGVVLIGAPGAGTAGAGAAGADTQPQELTGDPLKLDGDALTFPVSTLGGGVTITATRVTLQADVLFAFDSARLGAGARSAVAVAAQTLRARRVTSARVVGYTDAKGASAYNVGLSQRRAAAVRRALVAVLGAAAPTLSTEGRGERDPVAANGRAGRDDPRGRAQNRRVEVILG